MSGTNSGWIKLHRKLLDSPVWANPNLARFWIWCLLRASHNEFAARAGYSEFVLEPGEFIYTHGEAIAGTGLSQKVVRTCLESLGRENDPLLGRKRAGRYTIVTILKWRDYQIDNDAEGRKTGSKKAGKGQALLIGSKKERNNEGKIAPVDVVWDGEKLMVPAVLMEKYRKQFPRIDLDAELLKAETWLLREPKRASEIKSFGLFLTRTWFKRAESNQPAPDDYYEVSEADAAIQLQFERDLAAGRIANA